MLRSISNYAPLGPCRNVRCWRVGGVFSMTGDPYDTVPMGELVRRVLAYGIERRAFHGKNGFVSISSLQPCGIHQKESPSQRSCQRHRHISVLRQTEKVTPASPQRNRHDAAAGLGDCSIARRRTNLAYSGRPFVKPAPPCSLTCSPLDMPDYVDPGGVIARRRRDWIVKVKAREGTAEGRCQCTQPALRPRHYAVAERQPSQPSDRRIMASRPAVLFLFRGKRCCNAADVPAASSVGRAGDARSPVRVRGCCAFLPTARRRRGTAALTKRAGSVLAPCRCTQGTSSRTDHVRRLAISRLAIRVQLVRSAVHFSSSPGRLQIDLRWADSTACLGNLARCLTFPPGGEKRGFDSLERLESLNEDLGFSSTARFVDYRHDQGIRRPAMAVSLPVSFSSATPSETCQPGGWKTKPTSRVYDRPSVCNLSTSARRGPMHGMAVRPRSEEMRVFISIPLSSGTVGFRLFSSLRRETARAGGTRDGLCNIPSSRKTAAGVVTPSRTCFQTNCPPAATGSAQSAAVVGGFTNVKGYPDG